MTDFPAILEVQNGGADQRAVRGPVVPLGTPIGRVTRDDFAGLSKDALEASLTRSALSNFPHADFPGMVETHSIGDTWYEIIHVFPFRFDFGNILSTIVETIEIYNADRFASHSLLTFTNNAGNGISITNLPPLPHVLLIQDGLTMTLEVTPDGPPTIDGTLDFLFDLYNFGLPLTGDRIVMFPFEPELPVQERLRFLTDVLERKDGSEQRINLRKNPRQEFVYPIFREEGEELMRFDFLMFDWQARVFGLPLWTERTILVSDVTIGDTIVTVSSTDNADYRVGGLAIVIENEIKFEALEIVAIGSSTITFNTPFEKDFDAGVVVMPVRTANASAQIKGNRYHVNLATRDVQFKILDNDVGDLFADATPFIVADASSVLFGEILLDGFNAVEGTMTESYDRRVTVLDGQTGKQSTQSTTPFNRRGSSFQFKPKDRSDGWQVRRLLHAIKGRQKTFFVPTSFRDLEVTQLWSNGVPTLTVRNVGYARFAKNRNRYGVIRIALTDGTVLDGLITASAELSSTEEQITLNVNAPRDVFPEEFERIDFVQRVRLTDDNVAIIHEDGIGQSSIAFGVRSVIQ